MCASLANALLYGDNPERIYPYAAENFFLHIKKAAEMCGFIKMRNGLFDNKLFQETDIFLFIRNQINSFYII